MPFATRTFRVFVSSTFDDLKAERNALQRKAFPGLRTICEQHGARFQAIDLRWGVRDEAGLDQKTMEICLGEIERCQRTGLKPNFIVLLGQRYGWRPLPARIGAHEFDSVLLSVANAEERALAKTWYRRDDNAAQPEYLLAPRTGAWVETGRWQEVETRLHRILLDAARATDLSEELLVKYWASATHQEILKGLGTTAEDRRHVFVFCRRIADEACDRDLVSLRESLRDRHQLPSGNIHHYEPNDFEGLCHDVEQTLAAVIESEAASFRSRPVLALEIEAHDAFAHERASVFGRGEILDAITEYVREGIHHPLVLHGVSGCGKSAVMAQASERARAAFPSAVVVRRFIGVSPESSSGLTLLRSVCEEIGDRFQISGGLPADLDGVVPIFRKRLGLATAQHPLMIFLDALDQLPSHDSLRSFDWLGATLPPHCHIVVSTTELLPALSDCRVEELEFLAPDDAEAALDRWLEEAGRRLQAEQRKRVLAAFRRCRLPLYLRLAFEEARGWDSLLPPTSCRLGEGLDGIIDTLFDRLSLVANHGPLIVERSLGCLAAARYGLTEDEMLDVLSADPEVWEDFEHRAHHRTSERRLPLIVWSRLLVDLEPYLTERAAPGGTVVTFFHRQLAERAAERFLGGQVAGRRHSLLAGYFAAQPLWFGAGQSRPNARRAAELVYHQLGAGLTDDAITVLTDMLFVAAKCSAGLLFDLQADFRRTIAQLPEALGELDEERRRHDRLARWTKEIVDYSRLASMGGVAQFPEVPQAAEPWSDERIAAECRRMVESPTMLDRLRAFQAFIHEECHALLKFGGWPGFVMQHATNHAPKGVVHAEATGKIGTVSAVILLRRWSPRAVHTPKPALLATLEGHAYHVGSVAMTPDGRRAVSACGAFFYAGEKVSDLTVRVWDLGTGACLHTLKGHRKAVQSVSITPDGQRAVSGSLDGTLRVWELETGACLHVLKWHLPGITSVAMTPDGRLALSGGLSRFFGRPTVKVWNLETGRCLRTFRGHRRGWFCSIDDVGVTADGRRAVSTSAYDVSVWDVHSGKPLQTVQGEQRAWFSRVNALALTPDGHWAASGSKDGTTRLWDLGTGACASRLEGNRSFCRSVDMTPDRRLVVSSGGYEFSGSDDKDLRLWDPATGACLRRLRGHPDWINDVSVMADGRRAVSACHDGRLRLWDLETGMATPDHERHRGQVRMIKATADGKRAVSISGRDSGADENRLLVWNLDTGERQHVLDGHTGPVRSVCLSPDGTRAISCSDDSTMRIWDLTTGQLVRVLDCKEFGVTSVSITPDGSQALSGSGDKRVRLWDLESGDCMQTIGPPGWRRWPSNLIPLYVLDVGWDNIVSVTPDGRRALSVSHGQAGNKGIVYNTLVSVRVWELRSGSCHCFKDWQKHGIKRMVVTPDGRRAISTTAGIELRVWDVEAGRCLHVLEGHGESLESSSLAVSERWAASACKGLYCRDFNVRVWDLNNGACQHVLQGHENRVLGLAITPDGRRLLSCGEDRTLRAWDLETGACLAVASGGAPWTAADMGGTRLVAGNAVGEVVVFELRGVDV